MLTLQFIPHTEIEGIDTDKKIKKLLDIAKQDKIVLLEGRLRKEEEAELISKTMEEIDKKFKGIELSVVYPEARHATVPQKIKSKLFNLLLGQRTGFTIIGPATIIKEIRKDPDKIQLLTKEISKRKKR